MGGQSTSVCREFIGESPVLGVEYTAEPTPLVIGRYADRDAFRLGIRLE